MFAKMFKLIRKSGEYRVVLFTAMLLTASVKGQNLVAVLDLECDSSVPQKEVTAICDRISTEVSKDSTYIQFERSQLPELLKQLYIKESASACSDPQCLTVIGSLIGANYMVGGSIRYKNREINIELNLVDVVKKKALNTVELTSKANKKILIDSEIPSLVKNLLTPEKYSSQKVDSSGKKGFFANPLVYIGTGIASAIAGGAYYYVFYYKTNNSNGVDGNNDISLDDAPARTR